MLFPKIVVTSTIAAAFYTSSIDGFAGKVTLGSKPFGTNHAFSQDRHWNNNLLKATENDNEGIDNQADTSKQNTYLMTPRQSRIIKPLELAAATSCACCGIYGPGLFFPKPAFAEITPKLAHFKPALQINFPTALSTSETTKKLMKTLKANSFTAQTTLFGSSICSDEINTAKTASLHESLKKEYFGDQAFNLGGLGGLPFSGVSGMGAYVSHCGNTGAVENKLFIFIASHVGISEEGKVGKLVRKNMGGASGACGAAIGAYKKLMSERVKDGEKGEKKPPEGSREREESKILSILDIQEDYIVGELEPRIKPFLEESLITARVDPMTFVSYEMYSIARDMLQSELAILAKKTPSGFLSKDAASRPTGIAILGGVIINRSPGAAEQGELDEDFFQPLYFQSAMSHDNGTTSVQDLFGETFGDAPELACILGSQGIADEVLKATLLTKSIV